MARRHDVVIIGAGQGGLSTSYYLTQKGISHIVLEQSAVGHGWRSNRWDSFTLVTPNWTIRLPGAEYDGDDPDGFMARDAFVAYLDRWSGSFDCPVRCGVTAQRLHGEPGGYVVETTAGLFRADNVVVATSTHQTPRVPALAGDLPGRVFQLVPNDYKNPDQLPPGGVLVVGSAQTGCQIAEELNAAGRDTFLCVGRAGRLPRRYRGKDCVHWQRLMGFLDRTPDMLDDPSDRFRGDPHVSGKSGGHTLSLHTMQRDGITLLGHLAGIEGECVRLAGDLRENMEFADAYADRFYGQVDEYIGASGIDAPAPTAAELAGTAPSADWRVPIVQSLDLAAAGINTVIWAIGFDYDFGWIAFPVFDDAGYPATRRGATDQPGLYFMGLNWLYRRKSGILYGVGDDAAHVADHISRRVSPATAIAKLRAS